MDFIEYPLLSQSYPSQPNNSDTQIPRMIIKKPRRILKAKRLIQKSCPSGKDSAGGSSVQNIPDPIALKTTRESSHKPNMPLRAVQQMFSHIKRKKASVRPSDILFLENERLCGVGTHTAVPNSTIVRTPQHNISGISKLNVGEEQRTLQKRKILNSTDNMPKKRRTLDTVDKKPSTITNLADVICNNNKQTSKPKAMPNFARIFKVQSEETENIVEYKQRKAERAANLLSGAKPPIKAPKSTRICVAIPKMKRELTYTTENSPNIAKLPKLYVKTAGSGKSNKITGKKANFNENNMTKRTAMTCSTTCVGTTVPSRCITKTENASSNNIIKRGNINKFGFRQDNKPNCLNLARIPTISKRAAVVVAEAEAVCRKVSNLNEIKPPVKQNRVKKDELVKAVLTKIHPDREMAARRHEIKGVRLNRRFQLLMQLRSQTMP